MVLEKYADTLAENFKDYSSFSDKSIIKDAPQHLETVKIDEIAYHVPVIVEAVINKKRVMSLRMLGDLKIGDTIFLGSGDSVNVDLMCQKVKIASGKACKKNQELGVLIEEFL